MDVERRCWPVLIHQLLAMSLANDGVTAEDVVPLVPGARFPGHPPGRVRPPCELDATRWSLRLASADPCLVRRQSAGSGGRTSWELFAVFSSPQTYTVQTIGGQQLGSLNQAFVDRLVDGVSSFLLAGRGWVVIHVHHDDRRVVVQSAPRGRQPTWGGSCLSSLAMRSASAPPNAA